MTRVRVAAPAAALFVGTLALVEVLLLVTGTESFVLARPSEVVATLVTTLPELLPIGLATLAGAVGGLLLGGVLAVAVAGACARWAPLRQGLLPLAVAANSMPIIVLAPIANAWFGLASAWGTVAVVAVLVYFPIMINTLRGLLSTTPTVRELMASYAARPRTTMLHVQVPGALPFLFSALRIAAPLSVIGAIVKEYFGGPQERMGQFLTSRAALFQYPEAWAGVVLTSVFGLGLYGLVVLAERRLMPWHVSVRT